MLPRLLQPSWVAGNSTMPAFDAKKLEQVANALAHVLSHERICELFSREWGQDRKVVKRYIKAVERMWRQEAKAPMPVDERRAYYSQYAEAILRRQIANNSMAAAQQTLGMLARWWGIGVEKEPTTNVNIFNAAGALTSKAAIEEQLKILEAEQEARAQQLAATLITAGNTSTDDGSDDDGTH